jgi:hypothetical protein
MNLTKVLSSILFFCAILCVVTANARQLNIDSAFNPVIDNNISVVAVQNDQKILIGGSFANINGSARKTLARLNSDGSLDTGFNANTALSAGVDVREI